jgi:hypothetical protein
MSTKTVSISASTAPAGPSHGPSVCANDQPTSPIVTHRRGQRRIDLRAAVAQPAVQTERALNMEATRVLDLEEVFTQVLAINSLRDFVVHNVDGSEQEFEDWDPGTRYVCDALRSSRKSKSKTYLVGSATLAAMRQDCVECCWRLHPHWEAKNAPFQPDSGRGKRESWNSSLLR